MSAGVASEAWLVTTGATNDPAWQEALAGMESLREAGLAARLVALQASGSAEDAHQWPFDTTIVACDTFGPAPDARIVRDAVNLVVAQRRRPTVIAALEGDAAAQGLARIAALWGATLVARVRSWCWAGGFLSVVPEGIACQGNERVTVEVAGVRVFTLSRSFAAVGRPPRKLPPAAVERFRLAVPDRDSTPLRMLDTEPPTPDLTGASIVVAGGLGLGDATSVDLARDLAEALGGVVGGTRPIVDLGWLPPDRLIGATGRAITPDLYVALGISGATQHVSSIRARKVLSVNIDPAAAMTRLADLGLVGDVHAVVPALIQAIRGIRR